MKKLTPTRIGNFVRLQVKPGDKFNLLTVLEEAERFLQPSGQTARAFKCLCDCGKITEVRLSHLIHGRIKSCGHLNGEAHHSCKHPLYRVWKGMKDRCYDSKYVNANRYSERGITVCNEWRHSFTSFKEWALCNGYEYGLQIDRKNNDGNYEPSNCRFVSNTVNVNNREITFRVNYEGNIIPFMELARIKEIPETHLGAIRRRIMRGWDHTLAINTPIKNGNYKKKTA